MSVINTRSFNRFWPVSWTITLFFGPSVICTIDERRGAFMCRSSTLTIFGRSWYVSCTITHRFRVRERFPRLTIPGVRLRVRQQHSQFWPILTCFVDYYSPFLGPEVISTINEPRGAFTFRSSTLTLLSDSCLFCILLLTILGSRSDFHD